MRELAKKVEEHYLQPYPKAVAYPVFPSRVRWGLILGVIVGGILGYVWGALLRDNTIVIGGWENLYSMEGWAFMIFWVLAGIGLGISTIGVAATLMAVPPPLPVERDEED